jgi:hypothetical protein
LKKILFLFIFLFGKGGLLGGSLLFNIVNLTCFNVNTVKYVEKLHEIEKNADVGINTVGVLEKGTAVDKDPEYIQVKQKFLKFHAFSLGANVLSLAATIGQMYLLSSNVSFSY